MDNFQKRFLEEAIDLINDLEKASLALDANQSDKGIIEEIFRIMHSLKGGSAMFGFVKADHFTHNLESVFDLVRKGKIPVDDNIITITFSSIDLLKALFNENEDLAESVLPDVEKLVVVMKNIVGATAVNTGSIAAKPAANQNETIGKRKCFYVLFKPQASLFKNGTNPLYLTDELCSLGTCFVFPRLNEIPAWASMDPTSAYIWWDILIEGDISHDQVKDVFIFVEDYCQLKIEELKVSGLSQKTELLEKYKTQAINVETLTIELASNKEQETEDTNKQRKVVNGIKNLKEINNNNSIRVDSSKIDKMMNLVSELITTQARLSLFSETIDSPELSAVTENMQKLSKQLRDTAFSISLIPLQHLVTRFQRLVRDVAAEIKKDVAFETEGTETTELDRSIIDSLNEPIMHILRNSLDHGLETSEERVRKGKSPQGKILMKAFYSGTYVYIQLIDDGAGIDPERIRAKAVANGIISADAVLTQKEIYNLVFMAGFSTAAVVTDLSGRGVGMDVVRRKITDIRGEVEIDSKVDVGTTITIKIPLTLSIVDGLLVEIDSHNFIFPLSSVDKIYAVDHKQMSDFSQLVTLEGERIPYYNLSYEFTGVAKEVDVEQIVVVRFENQKVGIVIDKVLGEYQAVLKPLGKLYRNQDFISGASILGDGSLALVADPNKIIKKFANN